MKGQNQIIRDIKRKVAKGMKNANKLLADDITDRAKKYYSEYIPEYYDRNYSLLDVEEIPVTITGDTVSGGVINMSNAKGGFHAGDKTGAGQFNGTMISDPWTSQEVFEYSWFGNHGEYSTNGGSLNVWYVDSQTANEYMVKGMKEAGLNLTK